MVFKMAASGEVDVAFKIAALGEVGSPQEVLNATVEVAVESFSPLDDLDTAVLTVCFM